MKILIIEDQTKHIEDAKNFFEKHSDIDIIFALNFVSAQKHLESGQVDGVISDIFFPYNSPRNSFDIQGEKYSCCGSAVMILCYERVIPCILITDAHHHGEMLQWICSLQRGLQLPEIVDTTTLDKDIHKSGQKNWEEAFSKLKELIALGPCKKHNRYHWNVIRMQDRTLRRNC